MLPLAVGETLILMTPPFISPLQHLIQVEGGCSSKTAVSPSTATLPRSEKPIGAVLTDVDEMVSACDAAGVLLGGGNTSPLTKALPFYCTPLCI